ncbi:hypothetical protein [Novosphingobium sp. B1]|uniref:hypothetical protein n=1 Tax=Novosphingobium sp. B1 TaxID=1938756 RepID=UPI0009D8F902|nr:hypothetical protein [Novosphingobium sp. B1]SMC95006.1 hypothetical protein SAMN06272759_11370 [Novosphingobium sp. B1]
MTAHVRFKQSDVKRAAAGAQDAGLTIAKIEIDPNGKIVIIPGTPKAEGIASEWQDLE